ncbi:MAG: hypothetical protein LC751_14285 [Actinobacteria bacterium]|nr:hypothetical protein [Actinomycetota bacterium]
MPAGAAQTFHRLRPYESGDLGFLWEMLYEAVEHSNPALRLYERNGFVKLFETEDARTMEVALFAGEA